MSSQIAAPSGMNRSSAREGTSTLRLTTNAMPKVTHR
jgi:hypothetical protein